MKNPALLLLLAVFVHQTNANANNNKIKQCLEGKDEQTLCGMSESVVCNHDSYKHKCPNKCNHCPKVPQISEDENLKLCVNGNDSDTTFCVVSPSIICGYSEMKKLCPNTCNTCPKPTKLDKIRQCLRGIDNDEKICGVAGVCGNKDLADICPNKCKTCPRLPKFSKTQMTKIDCADWIMNGQVQAACWEADYKNDNDNEVVYFYPDPNVDGAFFGYVLNDVITTFYAVGDVTDENATITFRITSDKADDSGVEVNADSSSVPLAAQMYHAEGSNLTTRSVGNGVELNARSSLPEIGYNAIIQPVMDHRFQLAFGPNASNVAKGVTYSAIQPFIHSSAAVKFLFTVNEPLTYNQNVTATTEGYTAFTTSQGGPEFDFTQVDDNVTLTLVFTQTPYLLIFENISIEFAMERSVCGTKKESVAIIEDFGTFLVSSETAIRAIGNVLGFEKDYLDEVGYSPIKRFSADGSNCTKIGGFMDIPAGSSVWSKCSNEDIISTAQGGSFSCLTEISCGNDTMDSCPFMAKNIPGSCLEDFVSTACPVSCGHPVCAMPVLANATVNDTTIVVKETARNRTIGPALLDVQLGSPSRSGLMLLQSKSLSQPFKSVIFTQEKENFTIEELMICDKGPFCKYTAWVYNGCLKCPPSVGYFLDNCMIRDNPESSSTFQMGHRYKVYYNGGNQSAMYNLSDTSRVGVGSMTRVDSDSVFELPMPE